MKAKFIFIAMAIVLAAITQLQAQPNVPTINVDTLAYLGKGVNGEAGGAMFLPDGNILALWKGIPIVLDSKSGEIIRQLEPLSSGYPSSPELTKDGTKLVVISSGPKLDIWDVTSGKPIFHHNKAVSDFCISPDGTKLYITLPNNSDNPGLIAIYDMNTFQEIERLSFSGLNWAGDIDISPDGQTLLVSVEKTQNNEYDTKTNQLILIDLNKKYNYSVVETVEGGFVSMEFSPDGKQIALQHSGGTEEDSYIYIYNLVTKGKKYIRKPELSTLFGFRVAGMGPPMFIDSNIIQFEIGNESDERHYLFTWNILENKIKNYINLLYNQSIDVMDSTVLVCSDFGVIGYLNINTVSVQETPNLTKNTINYQEGKLVFETTESGKMDIVIVDYLGNTIWSLSEVYMNQGENRLPIPTRLSNGVYFCIVKSLSGTKTYKFMVY